MLAILWFSVLVFLVQCSLGIADQCSTVTPNQYPECSPLYHNITVSEALKKKSSVLQLNCSDPEGSKMKWKIRSGNVKKMFAVSSSGMLATNKKLDAEGKVNPYLLFIEARDSGTPQLTTTVVVTVFISSVNDEAPAMRGLPTQLNVSENSPRGTVVARCTLIDEDSARLPEGLARVRIVEGNDANLFRLDSRTCALTLNERLDYETMEPMMRLLLEVYELDVAAPLTAAQNITINISDYNDHPPNCTDYVILLTVPEDTALNYVLTSLNCSDVDVSDSLRYSIAPGSIDKLAVNVTSGEVTLAKPLDFERNVTNFDVIVHVNDVSSNPLTSTVVINVQVLDVDDSVPQFDSDVIHIEVKEGWDVGRVIWTLMARDADTPGTPFSAVTFTLLSPGVDWFHVHNTTGAVTIQELVDRERTPNVLLTVAAHSSDRYNLTSTVRLNITITDRNDNRPVFNQTFYRQSVKEGTPLGTVVCDVMASDADGDGVIFSSDSDQFLVNTSNGQIVLTGPLDVESRASYVLVVTATDADDSNMTSQALVRVAVEGQNEAPPVFQIPANDSELRLVSEDTASGTTVFSVSASDADHGDDGRVTYQLLQPPDSPFLVDVTGGDVILRSKLDRETRDNYTLVLQARDSSATDPKSASVTVTVSVTDVNDNGPVCQHVEPVSVNSSVSPGDRIITLSCSDSDLNNSSLTFVKSSGDVSGIFNVDTHSGDVKLARVPTLPRYEVLFEIRDVGSTGFNTYTTVIFIIEDLFSFSNLPTVLNITEDTEVGTVVLDVNTTGSRLPPFFRIEKDGGVFAVEPTTGEIYLTASLDRELRDKYEFTISASTAAGRATTATVSVSVLDFNDNVPDIQGTFNVSVVEDVTVPSVLQVFSARDGDLDQNSQVRFEIRSGNEDGRFSLTPSGTLSVVRGLDVETGPLHQLVIRATDGGSPSLMSERTVLIIVVNVDEFQPQFASSGQNVSLHIGEGTALGVLVVNVTADDADVTDDVRFDLVSGNSDGTFSINRNTGQLFLAKLLDREERSHFEVVVKISNAKRQSNTSVISVTVDDANDNPPTFSKTQYMYDVTDNTLASFKVGDLTVHDSDEGTNADFELQIVSENTTAFKAEGQSILTNQTIRISDARTYKLTIRATDKGSPPLSSDATVVIRVLPENKRPRFLTNQANITVEENSLTGTKIYDFQATWAGGTEGESGDLIYTITSGNQNLHFHLNKVSGELYIIRDLDYEENPALHLSVRAQNKNDVGLFDVMNVTVYVTNVNDVRPEFEQLTYRWYVKEGVYKDKVIGTVQARDGDDGPFGQVRYSIPSDAMFDINAITGVVTVTGQLDYNQRSNYFLSLTATDLAGSASQTGSAAIMVHVTDVNDHVPKFPDVGKRLKVSESAPVGTVVMPLLPRDEDSGDNANLTCDIVAGNKGGKFSVDPVSCVLTISTNLDAESQTSYKLVVTATDAGSPAMTGTTSLTIDVTDENDNSPRFVNGSARVQLRRSDPPGTVVHTATAEDGDAGWNGKILYSFLGGQADGTFTIDPLTGQVRTLTALAAAHDTYTLLLAATDRGYPPRTGTLTLSVLIYPARIVGPSTLSFKVPEDSPVGTVVGEVPWKDSSRTVLSHLIASGNFRNAFRVRVGEKGVGVMEVAGSVDREVYPEYHLVVDTQSLDSTGRNVTDSTVVKIEVTDVNDHSPVFGNPGLEFSVVENLPTGTTVARLNVSDDDVGTNADVKLSFAQGSSLCDKYFTLTSKGDIVIKEPPDYESLIRLTCEVLAEDQGSSPKKSTTTFTATVVDVAEKTVNVLGESASVFLSLEIPFDSSSGRLVFTLSAVHFGIFPSQGDTVSFLSLSQDGVFTVATATGEVRLGREDLLYDKSRYFQWVACRHQGGGVAGTQLGMLRVDAFSMDQHVVAVSVEASAEYLQSKRGLLRSRLQTRFGSGSRLEVLEIRASQGTSARRRVLNVDTVALVYVVNDTTADGVAGVDRDKTFMAQKDVLKVLQLSSDGTPAGGIRDSTLPVVKVMAYHKAPEGESRSLVGTVEGLALILVLIALFLIVVVFLFVCCLWRMHKKKRARKDSMSLLRNDSLSEGSQGSPSPAPQRKEEAETTSAGAEPGVDVHPSPKSRRLTLVIKEELDSLLPLPPTLTHRISDDHTPPAAPAHTAPTPSATATFLEKQAALNRLIEEKKRKKGKKTTTVLKGKSSGKVAQSPATTPRFQGHLRSEGTDKVKDIEDVLDDPRTGVTLGAPSSLSTLEHPSPTRQTPPMDPELGTLTSSPVLTARSVHVQPVQAWSTASPGGAARVQPQAHSQDSMAEEKNHTKDPNSQESSQASSSGKPGIFASIRAALGRKQNALVNKRASLPAAISQGEKRRLSHMAAAVTGQTTLKTAGASLTTAEERDIGLVDMKEGTETARQADRPENISTVRRQSLFV